MGCSKTFYSRRIGFVVAVVAVAVAVDRMVDSLRMLLLMSGFAAEDGLVDSDGVQAADPLGVEIEDESILLHTANVDVSNGAGNLYENQADWFFSKP